MIIGRLHSGQDWYVGPDHRFLVDGQSFAVSDVERLHMRLGELAYMPGTGPDGELVHAVAFTDPVSGLRLVLEMRQDDADELLAHLTTKKIQVVSSLPADLPDL